MKTNKQIAKELKKDNKFLTEQLAGIVERAYRQGFQEGYRKAREETNQSKIEEFRKRG